jgi:molybdopterin converting factor small subunit
VEVAPVQVRVRLFGDIAALAGQSTFAVDLDDRADVSCLLAALDRTTGRAVSASVLFNPQTIHPAVAILVNGSNVLLGQGLQGNGLQMPLREGDQVSVMPLISGGRA